MTDKRATFPRQTISRRKMQARHNADKIDTGHWRPKQRSDCIDMPRPCPFVGCRYHLFLDFTPAGSLKYNFGSSEDAIEVMDDTCSLDVADRGQHSMASLSAHLNVTPARAQQEVVQAMAKLKGQGLRGQVDGTEDIDDA